MLRVFLSVLLWSNIVWDIYCIAYTKGKDSMVGGLEGCIGKEAWDEQHGRASIRLVSLAYVA